MDDSKQPQASSIQFSVRTLLLVTANVGLLAAIGRISEHAFADMCKSLKAYAVLLTIYAWRFMLIQSQTNNRMKCIAFVLIFATCLPYIYLCIGSMFNAPFGLPPSKWIGTPIWIFAVPTLSFLTFDLNNR
jgi:hypothetical protein